MSVDSIKINARNESRTFMRKGWKMVEMLIMAQKGREDKLFCVLYRVNQY